MEVEDLIASEDKAVARVKATATHQGEFMGVPSAGTRVEVQLIDTMRFDDAGLVCEHWGVTDMGIGITVVHDGRTEMTTWPSR